MVHRARRPAYAVTGALVFLDRDLARRVGQTLWDSLPMPVLPAQPGPGTQGERSEASLRWEELQGYAFARAAPSALALFLCGALTREGQYLALLLIPPALVHLFPGLTARLLLRAGQAWAASFVARLDGYNWGRDRVGASSVMLALGLLRQPDHRALEKLLEIAQLGAGRVTPGTVLAEGIRSFVRGDRADARRLWRLVPEFDRSVLPPLVARLAAELLAAEAAEQGEFDRMLKELGRPRMASTRLTGLLVACARRLQGQPVPDGDLRGWWLVSGTWGVTLPLVDRVRARAPAEPRPVPEVADPLQTALISSARLGESPRVLRSSVVRAAIDWERALAWLPPNAPVEELHDQVVEVLAERLGHALDDPGPQEPTAGLFREVVWRCADQRDDHLRWLSTELGARTDQRRTVPLLDEVRAWCQLVDAYEAVIAVAPERAVSSFPRLYFPAVRHTVWLHNERRQTTVANAMYRVELRFAERAAHDSGITLLQNNLACGP